ARGAERTGRRFFRWPRGVVNVEPAVAEPAAPGTAATDAGAKPAKSPMDAYATQVGPEKKPAQRRPRPRLNHSPSAYQRPNFPIFGSSGWERERAHTGPIV